MRSSSSLLLPAFYRLDLFEPVSERLPLGVSLLSCLSGFSLFNRVIKTMITPELKYENLPDMTQYRI